MATTKKTVKPATKPTASVNTTKTAPAVCGTGCSVLRALKVLVVFLIDLVWFVIDILHAIGFILAALIASVALLIAALGVFLHFIDAPNSAEFQKLRENAIHIESIRRTPDMMRDEYKIMNEIRDTEKNISDMREQVAE